MTAPDDQVSAAVADLTDRLQVDAPAITIVSVEEVTWSDGSLGCPKPGMMYPQVLTPGRRIILEHGGRRYDYHCARSRPPFLCEPPGSPFSRRHPGPPSA